MVAPHPDDEVLGCGGFIHQQVQAGTQVRVLILGLRLEPRATDAARRLDPQRSIAMARAACAALGVTDVRFGGLVTRAFPSQAATLLALLEEERDTFAPDVVLIPGGDDTHQDHRATWEAARIAWRPVYLAATQAALWAYETPSTTHFVPTIYVPLSAADVKAKQAALAAHVDELKDEPHTRSLAFLEAQAAVHGAKIERRWAETFAHVLEVAGA